jgi:hypothetical protein
MRGAPVYDSAGEKLGKVEEIFYDQQTRVPQWIGIGTGVLVPVQGAQATDDGLIAAYSNEQVKGSPDIDEDEISQQCEARSGRPVLAERGRGVEIEVREVRTSEEARVLRFPGSPTIRIDGRDVDPIGAGARPALTCRIYSLPDGRVSPIPSREQLEEALVWP